ncbi:MAG: response regulator [Clostridiales Family XIII bacterium]|nr:response regulator [Clostridiales Family XIII bacterium]
MGLSIRAKLITIFLIVKIVPLVVLLLIAWNQFELLGHDIEARTGDLTADMTSTITDVGELAVSDSTNALIANAVEQIERVTTDTAKDVAGFLYRRDNDILYAATLEPTKDAYQNFIDVKTGPVTEQGAWDLTADGMLWERKDAPEAGASGDVSTNTENEDEINGASFHYRPADTQTQTNIPYYDEIAFIGIDLVEQFKAVPETQAKKHYPMDTGLKDISVKANTYIGAEDYGEKLLGLEPGEIYVSDVIGAYVPSHFVGIYTPKQMAVSAVNAEITALSAMEPQTEEIAALAERLAAVKTEGIAAIDAPGSAANEEDCAPLMKATADAAILLVGAAAEGVETPELTERIEALKTKIAGLKFDPYGEAFAGEENPLGKRFEGIVRWATPVVQDGAVIGYVSFALNHDHIMEFTDHITPMGERYQELSSAYDGNYAFIWDYQCRSICHPRHHSIVGYDPESGNEEIPWLETSLYESLLEKAGGGGLPDLEENWGSLVNSPQAPDPSYSGVDDLLPGVKVFDGQSRTKKPSPALTAAGYVGLDGRYLNNAPQCTGWMDLTRDGGSGSFYILWSGLYKLTTAAAIPYYTGQYAPSEENGFSKRGFAMVTVGAGLEDFQRPADETAGKLDLAITQANDRITLSADETQQTITENMTQTTVQLIVTTAIIVVLVIFIAIWMASFIANNINVLIRGLTRFRMGDRRFRFRTQRRDEFGELADSFDDMASSIETSITAPMSITDMDLNIIYMNDAALDVTNAEDENVVGDSYKTLSIYPFDSVYCPITALDGGKDPETYFSRRNGKYYKGRATYLTGKDGGKIGYVITSSDMTDVSLNRISLEQAVEEANRANEHKGEFLARMSHEIRTPMNAIIGITNIVEKKLGDYADLTPELHEIKGHVSQIENSSQHLLGLLNDILDLSKIEAGKIEITEEPVNIAKLAATVKEIIQPRCNDKQIDFTTDIDESLAGLMYLTDSLRLRQVLINLLGNAVKFTPELGRIRFTIKKLPATETSSTLRFIIEDTGIGIGEEARASIFEAFEQGDGGITRQYGGTGLGLPISRSIVRLLGSDIDVQSTIGDGSTFSFELELRDAGQIEADEELKNLGAVDFSGRRILIVDDVDINRMIAGTLLEYTGIEILEASDGKEAVEIFEASPDGSIDIILMDVMMPVMNGLEASVAIRASARTDAKSVPIIALTANAFKEDVDKTIASGMNAHLAKPIDPDSLIALMYSYLMKEN